MRVVSMIAVFVLTLNFAVSAQTTSTSGRTPVTPRTPPGVIVDAKCAATIKDQGDDSQCIMANSTPTLGMLYPYPGINNVFKHGAFVGGGLNNEATGFSTMLHCVHSRVRVSRAVRPSSR